jgi:hypothetical protein
MAWVHEGANVIYFLGQEEGQYDVDIFQLLKDLLYKYIPLTLYIRTKNVMDRESVFIAWDHNNTNVKYLPCAFKRVSLGCLQFVRGLVIGGHPNIVSYLQHTTLF